MPTLLPRLGQVVCTRGVADALADNIVFACFAIDCTVRHRNGDWGDLDPEDRAANDAAVHHASRVLSSYLLPDRLATTTGQRKLWIITEADRSVTTLLWPSEY